jgi:hypothetical protein
LYLGQTKLFLAKVKLSNPKRSSHHVIESSNELIADLESQLGNMTTEYLAVGISYKHSAFPTSRGSIAPPIGLTYRGTTIKIEAHAAIRRHCSQSSWSNQDRSNLGSNVVPNPVISAISAHCDPIRAAELIGKITMDPVSLADTNRCWDSSSDTIVLIKRTPSTHTPHRTTLQENSISTPAPKQSLDITLARFHDADSEVRMLALNPCSDLDPARKIWSEMRKSSRGTVKRRSHASKSCPETSGFGIEETYGGGNGADTNMNKEQARIMEMALRNKRSIGADTLRSMAAPSMGSSVGRGWGWGPPWW